MFKEYQTLIRIFVGILLLFTACAVPHPGPVCKKDQQNYGLVDGAFRSRWWNFYQRGQSYLEGECLKAAMADFKEAIDQNSRDQRMIRTYGMHFIDYFPHRELGLAYYLLEDLDEALKELQISVSQESSSKALHYIDQIRKKQIQHKGLKINKPSLTIVKNEGSSWTKNECITIEGTAADEQYVCHITINDDPIDINESKKIVHFKKDMILPQGIHHIPIHVKNLLGGSFTLNYDAFIDYQGPIIEIQSFKQKNHHTFKIDGIVSDFSGATKLSSGNKQFNLNGEKSESFSIELSVNRNHQDNIVLNAVDRAGNETQAVINIEKALQTFKKTLIASTDNLFIASTQKQPVNLLLYEWKKTNVVYSDKIYLEGFISSSSPLKEFVINQKTIDINKGMFIFFSIPINLNEGKNDIQLTIKNKKSQVITKQISFMRMIPEISQLKSRLHVSLNLLKASESATEERDSFQNMLLSSFIKRNRFYVIPKFSIQENINLRVVQSHIDMQVSHLTFSGHYVKSRYGIEVAIRVIDNETTGVLTVKDAYSESHHDESVLRMAESLSLRIHNEFPIMKGHIQKINSNIIQVSLGKQELKAQNRLIIFQPSEDGINPELLGFGRISEKNLHTSDVMIIHTSRPVSKKDRVITQ
jgi:tetratricopeptide (TPR) repeat protein